MTILKTILAENHLEEGYMLLTKREKTIIQLYYLEGYRDEEIANYYGIRRQIINRLRRKGLTKLKKFKKFLSG